VVSTSTDRRITAWLGALILLVIGMIVIGGVTRLTNSGLSITEWDLVSGILPPTSDEAWREAFDKYKEIPEFEAEHPDMDLSGFKRIFSNSKRQVSTIFVHRSIDRCAGRCRMVYGQKWSSRGSRRC